MKKSVVCMIFMLFSLISVNCFAFMMPAKINPLEEISYLDTVIVTNYEINLLYRNIPKGRAPTKEDEIGIKMLVSFSNHLYYEYCALDDVIAKEMKIKGPDHVYNVRLGDIVVVKVVRTKDSIKVTEFVANLSAR